MSFDTTVTYAQSPDKTVFRVSIITAALIHIAALYGLTLLKKEATVTPLPVIPIEVSLMAASSASAANKPDGAVSKAPIEPAPKTIQKTAQKKPVVKPVVKKRVATVRKTTAKKVTPAPAQQVSKQPVKKVTAIANSSGAISTNQNVNKTANNTPNTNNGTNTGGKIPVTYNVRLNGKRIAPTYPKRALRLQQEGVVRLQVLVTQTGQQQRIKVVKPSPYTLLDRAAINAVKKWRFKPTQRNGMKIASWVEIPIEFRIQ